MVIKIKKLFCKYFGHNHINTDNEKIHYGIIGSYRQLKCTRCSDVVFICKLKY